MKKNILVIFILTLINSINLLPIFCCTPSSINSPPNPPTLEQLHGAQVDVEMIFYINSIDPHSQNISYYINWMDGSDEWSNPLPSGVTHTISHTWTEQGKYSIMVKARNEMGAESNYSIFDITTSKQKTINHQFFNWLVEKITFLQRHLDFSTLIDN